MRIGAPTNPFHIAGAYGVRPPTPVAQPQGVQQAANGGISRAEAPGLIAGVVPGRVDFSGATAQPAGGALHIYTHPADRNAAATGVALGRSVDLSG